MQRSTQWLLPLVLVIIVVGIVMQTPYLNPLWLLNRAQTEGFTKSIGAVYQRATLVVMSPNYEAMSLTPIEAIAFGTPVVAFDCDYDPSEVIVDGVNGFLVPQK